MSERRPKVGKTKSPKEEKMSKVVCQKKLADQNTNNTTIKHQPPHANRKHMEVHHHPDLHHEKKPWKEYILEYIMIFLAVTTGFFAESLRENMTSKEHVAQLCTGLVQELKIDTASLGSCMSLQEVLVKNDDSLLMLLQQPLAHIDKQKLQRYAVKAYKIRTRNNCLLPT